MKKIEFIGASSAGKSTLFNYVAENRCVEDKWVTHKEAKVQLTNKFKKEIFLDFRKYCIPLISNHSGLVHRYLERKLINKYSIDILDQVVPEYNGLFEILIHALDNSGEMEPHIKMQILNYYFKILTENVALLEYLNYDGTVVYDECLIHNNLGCADYNLYNQSLAKYSDKAAKMKPDGIIFCSIDPKENLKRRKNRIRNGTTRFFERNLSQDDLLELCTKSCFISEHKSKVMHDIGVPLLKVDMSSSNEENALIILSFIRNINK